MHKALPVDQEIEICNIHSNNMHFSTILLYMTGSTATESSRNSRDNRTGHHGAKTNNVAVI
jgi:hypothetical protein